MWVLATTALAAPPRLDRVDLLSEAAAPFLTDQLFAADVPGDLVRLRFAEQIALVGALGDARLSLSLDVQELGWEHALPHLGPLSGSVGLRTHAFLPDGALAGLAVRGGPVRVGASLLVVSDATWSRPEWSTWRVLPGVGLGIGPARRDRAPWME